jgi:predicted SnoaL-like aldol condensation-catalyzing enzyme
MPKILRDQRGWKEADYMDVTRVNAGRVREHPDVASYMRGIQHGAVSSLTRETKIEP